MFKIESNSVRARDLPSDPPRGIPQDPPWGSPHGGLGSPRGYSPGGLPRSQGIASGACPMRPLPPARVPGEDVFPPEGAAGAQASAIQLEVVLSDEQVPALGLHPFLALSRSAFCLRFSLHGLLLSCSGCVCMLAPSRLAWLVPTGWLPSCAPLSLSLSFLSPLPSFPCVGSSVFLPVRVACRGIPGLPPSDWPLPGSLCRGSTLGCFRWGLGGSAGVCFAPILALLVQWPRPLSFAINSCLLRP
jgi:hypothetical protein